MKVLYEAKNENQIMALKEKLQGTKGAKGESVSSFLTQVAKIKDGLAAVGEVIYDFELVRIALKGFAKEWEVFVKCVVARENLPDWSRLWDDFTQKEIREGSQGSGKKEGANEENVALSAKRKKKSKKELRMV